MSTFERDMAEIKGVLAMFPNATILEGAGNSLAVRSINANTGEPYVMIIDGIGLVALNGSEIDQGDA